jgi:hypothetical protein
MNVFLAMAMNAMKMFVTGLLANLKKNQQLTFPPNTKANASLIVLIIKFGETKRMLAN